MSISQTTNLIGSVGADKDNAVQVSFTNTQFVGIVISGTGNARVALNGATPVNNTDAPIVGGAGMYLFRYHYNRSGGLTSVTLYVDSASSGAMLTYAVTPLDTP